MVNAVFLHLDDGPASLAALMRDMERRITMSPTLLGEVGAALVEPGSGVLDLRWIGFGAGVSSPPPVNREPFFVSCATTLPDGEGVEMAADLAAAGVAVELIPDDEIGEVMLGCDLVLMGTSAIGPDAAMNIMGSALVTRQAKQIGRAAVPGGVCREGAARPAVRQGGECRCARKAGTSRSDWPI